MAEQAGSQARGRRLAGELPPVPEPATLSESARRAQNALLVMVGEAGGRFSWGGSQIPVAEVPTLADRCEEWGRSQARRDRDGLLFFSGRPGLWHALDELVPLQDPNRWDQLRAAVIEELQTRGWTRSIEHGSSFTLPG